MQLDLTLPASQAARLTRLRLLAAMKPPDAPNPPRPAACRIVWHDGPDAALSAQGLALSEQAGVWRLERLRPDATAPFWPPGSPAPILAEAPTPAECADAHGLALPDPLVPCAAFEGRCVSRRLAVDGALVDLTVRHGVLRSVSGEQPAARLTLDGPEEATLDALFALAAGLDLAVPRASLAAEALAAARGQPVAARRLGPPALPPGLAVADAFAQVVGHLADVLLYWAPLAAAADPGLEPVHQMRVALRRLRSAITLFRRAADGPALQDAQAGLKTLSHLLGPARDWDVFVTGTGREIGGSFPQERAVARLLDAAQRRRADSYAALRQHLAGPAFRRLGLSLMALSVGRFWDRTASEEQRAILDGGLHEFAGRMLNRRLKQVVNAADELETLPPEALHAIRLRGKRLRYAAEVFAPLFPGRQAGRFIRRLTSLQERLGALNDTAVAAGLMAELGGHTTERAYAVGVVRGFVAAAQDQSRSRMNRTWKKFRRQDPFWS